MDANRGKMHLQYDLINLRLNVYDYDEWYKEGLDDSTVKDKKKELDDKPRLEGDEEVKEGKGLEVLFPNKLLTKLPRYY